MAPPRSKWLIAQLIVAVGTAETAHIVFTFPCFVAMAGEAWKRKGLGPGRPCIFSIGAWHQLGLKCNHASYSYCLPLPSCLFNHFNYTERHACDSGRVTQPGGGWDGGSCGGWGCPNVAKGRKNSPVLLLCYLLVSWALPNASIQP